MFRRIFGGRSVPPPALNSKSLGAISNAVTNFVTQYNNALSRNANNPELNSLVANHQMKIGRAVTNAVKKNRNSKLFANARTTFPLNNPPAQRRSFLNRLRGSTASERAQAKRNANINAIYKNTKQSPFLKKRMLNNLSANKTNERYVALLRKLYKNGGGVVNANIKTQQNKNAGAAITQQNANARAAINNALNNPTNREKLQKALNLASRAGGIRNKEANLSRINAYLTNLNATRSTVNNVN
jgi:hypothetical protein